uniref:Uncharacterized protein n=1 Tax=uncultured delta proteobacterium HF0130_19C20 TaxID=710828 RepID=E0XT54_9DELT|nr:hypothetical protein [uncultured delta proteobacterium HF0130_19C20]
MDVLKVYLNVQGKNSIRNKQSNNYSREKTWQMIYLRSSKIK